MEVTKTILIVEDNPMDRTNLFHILNVKGYQVLEAKNGLEALTVLESEKESVDLILLDIFMPVMDGFVFLKKIKETGMLTNVPVIVMTGENQEKTEIYCLKEGASDFLKKPYHPELVQHRVESILRLWDNALRVNQMETDRLTGVYNKESFYRHAEVLLEENSKKAYSVLYLNVEDFKMINARYGTEMGDRLLKFFAGILQDYAGETGICGRIGSDIFGMLVEQKNSISQKEAALLYEERMETAPVKGVVLKCGVYPIAKRTLKVTDMIDRAKIAEESIKHRYGLYYAVYDDSIRRKALREHQLVNCMAESLEKKEFVVYLQPKHSTQTGAVVGAEALVRWIHPELGFISPGEFIPLFERNGFIAKLDYYVWEVVCKTLHRWLHQGQVTVPLSINASRADFLDPDLPEKIVELTQKYEIPSKLIHLEVTESAYTDNPQQIISAVSVLRDFGYQIEMDDFGSGYSSLNMLSELPIDILKLDMRFVQKGSDRLKGSKRNILSFIVSLSKWLQLPTVAEGVETKEEFELLKSMGCNYIQGYYFAKPMPIEEFETYIKKHSTPWEDVIKEEVKKNDGKPEVEDKEKPLILVVEDIDSNRKLMKLLLSAKYRVATAENGKIAYEYMKEHRQEISCILLDLLMPVMDGFQLLELLQKEEILTEIPVIITTETGSDSELRALNLGAHSFVAKPYNPNILRHHVRKAIEEKELLAFKREYEKNKNRQNILQQQNREVQ